MGTRSFLIFIVFGIFTFQCMSAFSSEASFLVLNGDTGEIMFQQGPHINERVTPACSFNIALSLMGYDAEILTDENTPIWDFQEGYDDASESWTEHQSPSTWMTRSCLWYSKLLALHIGLEAIQNYIIAFDYGNQDMSGGLTQPGQAMPAWVSSSLKISPIEQAGFVHRMLCKKLSVSSCAIQKTKTLLYKEELPEKWKLYGKTGLGSIIGPDGEINKVRWFVGWIENDNTFFPFAYQLRQREIDVTQTVFRVKALLAEFIRSQKSCATG